MKKIKEQLDKLQDTLDLKKIFPGYFDKKIFRGVIILMVIFTAYILFSTNFKISYVYAECPENNNIECGNPFYVCNEGEIFNCIPKDSIPKPIKPLCYEGFCNNKTLQIGQVIGEKPSFIVKNYNILCLLIVLAGFLVNHIVYKTKKKVKI